mmetsp:Transcript_6801/g.20665  ORF Transcript_6801/g.20665 Transcript_6801/m.20665 type:complete len:192 (-) Transcript_6801:984-1559(-)
MQSAASPTVFPVSKCWSSSIHHMRCSGRSQKKPFRLNADRLTLWKDCKLCVLGELRATGRDFQPRLGYWEYFLQTLSSRLSHADRVPFLESRFQKLDPCCSWRLLLEVFAVDGAQLLSDMVQPELLRLFWSRLALSTTLSAIRKYVGFISTLHGLHLRRTERAQMFFAAGHRRFTAHLRAGINWRQTSERG